MEMLTNLGITAICMAACYLPYYFVFRKYTFFTLNRWYLLASLVVSLLIPFVHIKTTHAGGFNRKISIEEMHQTGAIIVNILVPAKHAAINWLLVMQGVYWAVAAVLAIKLLFTLCLILYRAAKYGERANGQRMVYHHSGHNSSFFNILFLDVGGLTADEQQTVLTHEQAHVSLGHSADNLFTAVLKVILWFNPFVYLMANSLKQTHEFEVDALIASKQNPKTYASLLYKMSVCNDLQLLNQFSSGSLKSRVSMLFKNKTAGPRKLQYIVALLFLSIFSLGFIVEGKTITAKLPQISNVLLHKFTKQGPPSTSTFRVRKAHVAQLHRQAIDTVKHAATKIDTTKVTAWANDSTYINEDQGIAHLYGDAHVTYGKLKFIGDYAKIDQNNHTIFVRKARIEDIDSSNQKRIIEVDSVLFNMQTKRALSYSTINVNDLPHKL